jgi:hypothetical protein
LEAAAVAKAKKPKPELVPDSIVCEWGMCTCREHRFPHPPHRLERREFLDTLKGAYENTLSVSAGPGR